jgi:APA family basic amino acid/polyamine antiporter
MLLAAWILTGIMTMLGALAYGELAAIVSSRRGAYVFLREALGLLTGFLYGWTLFVVIQTGTIAAVAVAFGRFLGVLWPAITPDRFGGSRRRTSASAHGVQRSSQAMQLGLTPQRLIALLSVWLLTFINLRGVRGASSCRPRSRS